MSLKPPDVLQEIRAGLEHVEIRKNCSYKRIHSRMASTVNKVASRKSYLTTTSPKPLSSARYSAVLRP